MTTEAMLERERLGNGGALAAGPRASWSALLAGAVTMLAVTLLLWSLAAAIVALSSTAATPAHANVLALWICGMVATLLGALAGGYAAGMTSHQAWPGIGALHGFLAWTVALLGAFLLEFSVAKTFVTTVAQMEPELAGVTMAMPDGTVVTQEATPSTETPAQQNARMHAMRTTNHDRMIALSWSWFGTWLVAAFLATAAGAAGARSVRGGRPWSLMPRSNSERRREEAPRKVGTPAPSH